MNKPLLFVLLFFFLLSNVYAQSDSVKVVKANWQVKRVASGMRLKQIWFKDNSLFNANQFISILEVKQKRKTEIDLGYETKKKKPTSVFGQEANAIAAINGTFFDVKNGGSVDFIRANGAIINENQLLSDGERARHQQAALVISKGKLNIAKWDGTGDWEKKLDGEDVMLSGPLLVYDKQRVKLDSASFNVARHPRTAIATTRNNRILFITVDGRDANAAGMSLFELADVLKWLKCHEGINMDGGGSTALWIRGEPGNGIVNNPSDDKKWGPEGERKVANVVLVKRR